jgi:hypothetical protein
MLEIMMEAWVEYTMSSPTLAEPAAYNKEPQSACSMKSFVFVKARVVPVLHHSAMKMHS